MGSETYNTKRKKSLTRHKYLSIGDPTYWPSDPNEMPDLLDFFILHDITSNYTQGESNFDLSSDHSPVIATTSTYVISKSAIPTLITKQTNCDTFVNT
jgi:hypothetical protein